MCVCSSALWKPLCRPHQWRPPEPLRAAEGYWNPRGHERPSPLMHWSLLMVQTGRAARCYRERGERERVGPFCLSPLLWCDWVTSQRPQRTKCPACCEYQTWPQSASHQRPAWGCPDDENEGGKRKRGSCPPVTSLCVTDPSTDAHEESHLDGSCR